MAFAVGCNAKESAKGRHGSLREEESGEERAGLDGYMRRSPHGRSSQTFCGRALSANGNPFSQCFINARDSTSGP